MNYGNIITDKDKKILDAIFNIGENPNTELGLRLGHVSMTQRGDEVVIIGGGMGISTVTAARQVGERGHILTYEARSGDDHEVFGIKQINRTLELNGVKAKCETILGQVGTEGRDSLHTSSRSSDSPAVHASELPDCDVLEFDCNGMELVILENMEILPRVLLVEIEARFYKRMYDESVHPKEVFDVIDDLGYTVVQRMGHEGKKLSEKEQIEKIKKEFRSEEPETLGLVHKESSIIVAVRNDYIQN